MGQQQLILLVLATVIVGLATVVGIRAFAENSIKANADAMVQDAVRIANDAQAWKKKPAPFGGQTGTAKEDPADFSGLTVVNLGYQAATAGETFYQNLNGCYQLTPATTGLTIQGINVTEGTEIELLVDGLSDTDVTQNSDPVLGTSTVTTNPCGVAL